MEVVYESCCGLDVHKKSVVACVITPEGKRVRKFGTMTTELMELAGWLAEHKVTHVAMESTGVYWKPVYLSSWAKVCPGNNESAGKRKSGRTGQGNPWLSSALTEAAWAASRTKNTYLSAQYRRIAPRRGSKRAIRAVAHSIIVTIYHMLKNKTAYHGLGGNYFDNRDHQLVVRRSVRRIERLGYKVSLSAA